MTRPRKTEPETSQDEPTRPRARDENGRMLDEHGLPLAGPARLAALDGKPDPALEAAEPADEPDASNTSDEGA